MGDDTLRLVIFIVGGIVLFGGELIVVKTITRLNHLSPKVKVLLGLAIIIYFTGVPLLFFQ